jgi:3-oxoacyl-[acyl-carrier protein] reductase
VGHTQDLADLKGRVALVTGAGQVGQALAVSLARHNASAVAVVDLSKERAEHVAGEVEAAGARGLPLVADLTDPESVAEMTDAAGALGRPIDILVNNAGMPPGFFSNPGEAIRPFVEQLPEHWAPLLRLNLDAVLSVTHAFIGDMIEQRFGRVISIVSDSARTGDRNMAVYAAAKGGTAAFMRSLASEVGPHGVTVNCVSLSTLWRSPDPPGEEQLRRMARHYPLGFYGDVSDVAAMVTFLASDAARWITGQTYGVNGGYAYGL